MIECRAIVKQIDEAERADQLPAEAENHIAACKGCRSFAEERAALRNLVASVSRVQAPANFDALLRERLNARRRTFLLSWLSPAALARLSAAAAVAVVVIFVARFALSPGAPAPETGNGQTAKVQEQEKPETSKPAPIASSEPPSAGPTEHLAVHSQRQGTNTSNRPARASKRPQPFDLTAGYTEFDPQYIIVRGNRGETAVPILPVSAGAQPKLYSAPRRQQTTAVKTSF